MDLVVTFSNGAKIVRQGMTPDEMERTANTMGQLSNTHPMIFGPRV